MQQNPFCCLVRVGVLSDSVGRSLTPPQSEVDHTFPLDFRRKAEDILVEKKATYHIQVFSGVTHGFSLRGNVNDPVASQYAAPCPVRQSLTPLHSVAEWAKEQSATAIKSWFDVFCGTAESTL